MIFRGVSVCNVDTKGRFAMPTKYPDACADAAANECVMTIDTEDDRLDEQFFNFFAKDQYSC